MFKKQLIFIRNLGVRLQHFLMTLTGTENIYREFYNAEANINCIYSSEYF